MGTGNALRELATFVEACESGEGSVTSVCFAECVDPTADDALRADVELTLSADASETGPVSLRSRIDADGRLTLALESGDAVVPTEGHAVAIEPADVTLDGDGTVTVTLSAAAPTDGNTGTATRDRASEAGPAVEESGGDPRDAADGSPKPSADSRPGADSRSESTADSRAVSAAPPERDPDVPPEQDRDVPPFRDRELLASVYESEDTFAEMAERLEMDVTAETVRRYMIDYDIHEPDSYDTGRTSAGAGDSVEATDGVAADAAGDGDADATVTDDASPVVLSDGIGLPDDVTVDTLIESVKRSNTIYEVTQDVDMGRHEALEMLQDLNLLDLVVGRLATETDRHITREDVVSRLREVSETQ